MQRVAWVSALACPLDFLILNQAAGRTDGKLLAEMVKQKLDS